MEGLEEQQTIQEYFATVFNIDQRPLHLCLYRSDERSHRKYWSAFHLQALIWSFYCLFLICSFMQPLLFRIIKLFRFRNCRISIIITFIFFAGLLCFFTWPDKLPKSLRRSRKTFWKPEIKVCCDSDFVIQLIRL